MSEGEIPSLFSEIRERNVEVNNRNNSAELTRHPIKWHEEGFDKIFIQASSVDRQESSCVINIDSKDPTVVFNGKIRTEYGLDSTVLVDDLVSGKSEKTLVSGGVWVWLEDDNGNEFLSLMRRDMAAPKDAGCLTGPAGRCGEKLSQTSVSEINQDFIFIQTDTEGNNKLLAFYRNDEEKDDVINQKLRQVEEVSKSLLENYEKTGDQQSKIDADFLKSSIKGRSDIQFFKMEMVPTDDQDNIITNIDGEEVDRISGFVYMDEKNHTLEVREEMVIRLPFGSRMIKVMDGGLFMRPTVLVKKEDLSQLLSDDLVPALRNYIERKVQ